MSVSPCGRGGQIPGHFGFGPRRRNTCQRAGGAVDVLEFLQRAPAGVAAFPFRVRIEPDRKRIGEVLVRMLLRVTAGDVPHVIAGEGDERVVVAIRFAHGAEQLAELRRAIELIRVIECVAGLVAQVHHDLALALDVVQRVFERRHARVAEVEGDADDRLAGGGAPLIGQIAARPEVMQPRVLQLGVQTADELRDRRALQREAEVADAHRQKLPCLGRRVLERDHALGGLSNKRAGEATTNDERGRMNEERRYPFD